MIRQPAPHGDDSGSAIAEFVMVVSLLTFLTLSVLQFALALHVRNTVLDAAAEGARYAALADSGLTEGEERTRLLITAALGESYARNIEASFGETAGYASAEVSVVTPLPLLGLLGFESGLSVVGHAAVESLD